MDKAAIARILYEISLLLEFKNENPFKIRAFSNAARVLEGCPDEMDVLLCEQNLEQLKGIGKGHIARIVRELCATGHSKDYEDLKRGFPPTLFELFNVPGMGPKRVKILYEKLKIKSLDDLKAACRQDKIAKLERFGPRSQAKIMKALEQRQKSEGRFLIDAARAEADKLLFYMRKQKGIKKIELAGSIRRSKETVKDIDLLICAENPAAIHAAFAKYPETASVIAAGETKSSIALKSGMNADLRTVSETEFPYALYYFTGSKEHNVAVRTIAKKKGIKINEYGLFKGKRLLKCENEKDIFEKVGLHYIPPEARENTGEIEWAAKKEFPRLVEEGDIRGVFHVHSDYSDGVASLEAMIAQAERMGLEYVGISDHSRSAAYAGGLEIDRVKKQWKEIDKLQKKFKIRIFKGTESDILADGSLDYPEEILKGFDFVIGSIHSKFNMPEDEMTHRISRAMQNKYMTFLGHPTGRLLMRREGYKFNTDTIFKCAEDYGVVIELNADPNRLDLDWRLCQSGKKKGLAFGIHPDAHSVDAFKYMAYGIGIARKGWLEKKDVVNTMPLAQIEKFLQRKKPFTLS